MVYLVDNKALTRTGNVSSVSALTTNFAQNLASVRGELQAALDGTGLNAAQRETLRNALAAIDQGRYVRAVTNANVAEDGVRVSGVTEALAEQGIRFLDVFR